MEEDILKNSFFYFFSATPQVLGGVMALLGVFVIFKIQTIKSQLIGIGKSIYNEAKELIDKNNPSFTSEIKQAIKRKDIHELKRVFDSIEKEDFGFHHKAYQQLYDFHINLMRATILLSIFTAVTIILCLSVIPFGTFFLKYPCLLYILFIAVIASIIICLGGFLFILVKSLKESSFKKFSRDFFRFMLRIQN